MTNVLILMSDEHNAHVAVPYGHPFVDTPNMTRLAERGTIFDAAYCPSPLCAPSRSSFLSGLPVHRTGVINNCVLEYRDLPSYGGVLAAQGIQTVTVGKTDVYTNTDRLGFSAALLAGDRKMPGDTNFRRDPLTIREDGPGRANQFGPRDHAFASDTKIIDAAVGWLDQVAPTVTTPWTLTVNIVAPHFPHYASPELWEKYAGYADLPSVRGDVESAQHPYALDLRHHFQTGTFSDYQIQGLRQGYWACVDYVDQQLGRLLDALDRSGAADDTIVVYTSDHGEMLGTFDMWWKCSMYEDSARVPLIAAGPGFAAGVRSSTPVTLYDLQASLFRATGCQRPNNWWGVPLQDLPLDSDTRSIVTEYHGHGTRGGTLLVREGPWKLLHHERAPHQLFNLEDDPGELSNCHELRPDVVVRLDAALRTWCDPEEVFQLANAREQELLAGLAAAGVG